MGRILDPFGRVGAEGIHKKSGGFGEDFVDYVYGSGCLGDRRLFPADFCCLLPTFFQG